MPRVQARTVAEHRRNMVERMYRSFETLIYERGYDAIALADIAKAAGMTRTTMYNYFPDKESLLLAYTAHEMDEFFSGLRVALTRADDPLDKLDEYVAAQVRYFATHHLPPGPALRSVVSGEGYRELQRHAQILEETLSVIIEEGVAEGAIPDEVVADGTTVKLVLACLGSGPIRDVRGKQLAAVTATAQGFVRRAVGAATGP